MGNKTVRKIISPIPMLLLLFIIFGFSGQTGEQSGSLSLKVCIFIVNLFGGRELPEADLLAKAESIQFFVRKLAHVTEYAILTLSVYWPLTEFLVKERHFLATRNSAVALARMTKNRYDIEKIETVDFKGRIIIAAALTLVYASLDELHQTFVAGRSGRPVDVFIDTIGIVIACAGVAAVRLVAGKNRKRRY